MSLDAVQLAAQAQFAKQSQRYGSGHILANVADVQDALAHITLPPQARVLDVATGGGHTGLYLASLGYEVTLADIAEPMLDRARAAAQERGLRVQTRQHPAEDFPYPGGSFDLVTCRVAPHHFSSPEEFVAETARVLAPGGYFLLIDGSVPDNHPEAEEWIHQVEKLRDPSHHRFLSPDSWSALCKKSGLSVCYCALTPMKQPDLEWYFETAATSAENREAVRTLIQGASPAVREVFQLSEEEGKTIWWWPRLTLIAQR